MEIACWKIDPYNHKPIHEQLCAQIQAMIEQGQLQPDERLPTVRALAALLGVNFNTVARAYRKLDQQGWVITRQGQGTYVLARRPSSNSKAEQKPPHSKSLKQLVKEIIAQAEDAGIPLLDIRNALDEAIEPSKSRPQ